jgi:hypothetical protein
VASSELGAALERLGVEPKAHLGGYRTTLERFDHINTLFKMFGIKAEAGIRAPMPFDDYRYFNIIVEITTVHDSGTQITRMGYPFKTTNELAAFADTLIRRAQGLEPEIEEWRHA